MLKPIHDDFRQGLDQQLTPLELGTGKLEQVKSEGLRLVTDPCGERQYSDAQIYNYARLKRRDFPSRPPLRMVVRAWASHDELTGTAGFGFWNQPAMPGQLDVRLPRAVWFFYGSRQSNMAFAENVPGHGWKAATLDASRLPFILLAPTAPLGFLLMRNEALYRKLWPVGQWAIGAAEKLIDVPLTEPHTYRLDWLPEVVRFFVDEHLILETPFSPRGPLGFVAWGDNPYTWGTRPGHLGMGLVLLPE